MNLLCNRDAIDLIASRIERAYRRRNPNWIGAGQAPGVWESAASRLLEVSIESPKMPVDPELFVAVLATGGITPDPWAELTQRRSKTRYLGALRRIIGMLRRELEREIRRAGRQILAGKGLDEILKAPRTRISPLTCYILAFRAGRFDLADKYRPSAENQHLACPLYRQAARSFLPNHSYPIPGQGTDAPRIGQEAFQFSLN